MSCAFKCLVLCLCCDILLSLFYLLCITASVLYMDNVALCVGGVDVRYSPSSLNTRHILTDCTGSVGR